MAKKTSGGDTVTQKYWADGVPTIDTERQQLETVLQTARDFSKQRRPDGRKSPTLLACEEVFRLQEALKKAEGRAYVAKEEANRALNLLAGLNRQAAEMRFKRRAMLEGSLWFRFGRRLRFYT